MGFLFPYAPGRAKRDPFHGVTPEFMMAAGCSSCPYRHHPKAEPSGPVPCDVYILGEAPGDTEAKQGVPFVGKSGALLRRFIPRDWNGRIHMNNVVKSLPPKLISGKQGPPSDVAIQHCRGHLIRDIEATKPKAILGLGNVALQALTGHTGITRYAGRKMPVKIGNHTCWYFALGHPAAVLYADERTKADLEYQFGWRLQKALARVATLPEPKVDTPEAARSGIRVLRNAGEVLQCIARATKLDRVGIDYETTGFSPYGPDARLLTVAIATGVETVAFPLGHREAGWTENERSAIYGALGALLRAPVLKIAHNVAFEMLWTLDAFGVEAIRPTRWGDSLAQAFLLDSRPRAHSLDFLCQLHFGLALKSLSNIDVAHLDDAPVEDVCRYNALDAKYCRKVFEVQEPVIERAGMQSIYHHHVARMSALVRGQYRGLPVDANVNQSLIDKYTERLHGIEVEIKALPEVAEFERAGVPFNVNSVRHVGSVTGSKGTSEEVLEEIGTPLAKGVLKWRATNKILSTYLTPLKTGGDLVTDGRIHPVISTTHTRTWRTAAEAPNIQNFPTRDALHREVRKQIVAEPGCLLVSVDYSSIQARNVAMESEDQRLVQAFVDRYDMHQDWSERIQRQVRGWAKGRERKTLRHSAKNGLVFPLFFGSQPHSIARNLGVDVRHGQALYDQFWGEFPDIRIWHEKLRRFYSKNHYVTGLSGFRRHAPISDNQLINSPIQSDEALLVCEALVRLSQYEDEVLQPVAMIHDDLTFMVPRERFDEVVEIILFEMLRIEHLWINVPLAVEVAAGPNWASQENVGTFESDGLEGYVEV